MALVRSLFDWLDEARLRPGMFVRGHSLADLENQCIGWEAALAAHGIDEAGARFNARFRNWLRAERGMSVCRGWAEAIRRGAASDEEAWESFFTHLDAFRRHDTAAGSRHTPAGGD